MTKTLLYGYGNIDRQDDGVAWHILRGVAEKYNQALPAAPDETTAVLTPDITWAFALQLTPESAEMVGAYDRVIFIDAHTGSVQDELNIAGLDANYQASPFTHHLTPQTCLALAQSLFGKLPNGVLVSVRGFDFGFSQTLSPAASKLSRLAVERIMTILRGNTGDFHV